MSLSSHLLHADTLVNVRQVECRPHDHGCGHAEAASANSLAFPLRGVFVKHLDDGREVVAHAGQAVFLNAGESYRGFVIRIVDFRHPASERIMYDHLGLHVKDLKAVCME